MNTTTPDTETLHEAGRGLRWFRMLPVIPVMSAPPPGTIEVRALTAADLPAALELWSATAGVEVAEGDRPEELARFLARNPGFSTVAEEHGALVGAVLCGHDGRRGYVYHLAIRADRRGHGLGRRLMRRSLGQLQAAGLARALLLVEAGNQGGREFWLREGWEELTGARPMGFDL